LVIRLSVAADLVASNWTIDETDETVNTAAA
jgi:hypothetical protein